MAKNHQIKHQKEFFDRDYTVREAYGRIWKYARKYRFRLFVGVLCGMLTAGTLVPFFQIVQPTLQHVEGHDTAVAAECGKEMQKTSVQIAKEAEDGRTVKPKNAFEKQIAKNSKLPGWYPKVEKFASRLGIKLQDEKGGT